VVHHPAVVGRVRGKFGGRIGEAGDAVRSHALRYPEHLCHRLRGRRSGTGAAARKQVLAGCLGLLERRRLGVDSRIRSDRQLDAPAR
jgi:hypothetical protein